MLLVNFLNNIFSFLLAPQIKLFPEMDISKSGQIKKKTNFSKLWWISPLNARFWDGWPGSGWAIRCNSPFIIMRMNRWAWSRLELEPPCPCGWKQAPWGIVVYDKWVVLQINCSYCPCSATLGEGERRWPCWLPCNNNARAAMINWLAVRD